MELTKQMKRVWDAPANYNRASRRAARLWGRIWKWDVRALGVDPDLPPRCVRRHWSPTLLAMPNPTRRQRRHKACVLRAMKARI